MRISGYPDYWRDPQMKQLTLKINNDIAEGQ